MPDYPQAAARVDQVESVPRRVRAVKDGVVVVDTTSALYVFEWAFYPQFHVPAADVRTELLHPDGGTDTTARGTAAWHGLDAGSGAVPRAARWLSTPAAGADPRLADTVRFEWDALDAWYEEDEQVFVHPRNPYVRVDAIRSNRHVRVELDGVVLAESSAPVLVFETGLPTRFYLERTSVDFSRLVASTTRTSCPYKGVTSGYWSARTGDTVHPDVAWSYDFPTAPLLPVTGMVAFLDEHVDVVVDGVRRPRPETHFS